MNSAAEPHPQKKFTDIMEEQLVSTFRTNLFSMFFLIKAAMPHLRKGASIIHTSSITAYRGSERHRRRKRVTRTRPGCNAGYAPAAQSAM